MCLDIPIPDDFLQSCKDYPIIEKVYYIIPLSDNSFETFVGAINQFDYLYPRKVSDNSIEQKQT